MGSVLEWAGHWGLTATLASSVSKILAKSNAEGSALANTLWKQEYSSGFWMSSCIFCRNRSVLPEIVQCQLGQFYSCTGHEDQCHRIPWHHNSCDWLQPVSFCLPSWSHPRYLPDMLGTLSCKWETVLQNKSSDVKNWASTHRCLWNTLLLLQECQGKPQDVFIPGSWGLRSNQGTRLFLKNKQGSWKTYLLYGNKEPAGESSKRLKK